MPGLWSHPEALGAAEMQWISHQLPCTLRGCVKLGTPLTHPDFGGAAIVVTVPLACTLKHELTRIPYFCRQQSGRTRRKMQLFPMAETNLPSLTAAVKKAHYLCSWLSCFYPRDHRALTTHLRKPRAGPGLPLLRHLTAIQQTISWACRILSQRRPREACRPRGGSRDSGVPCRARLGAGGLRFARSIPAV